MAHHAEVSVPMAAPAAELDPAAWAALMISLWSGWCPVCGFLYRYGADGGVWCGCALANAPDPVLEGRLDAFRREWDALTTRRWQATNRRRLRNLPPVGALLICAHCP